MTDVMTLENTVMSGMIRSRIIEVMDAGMPRNIGIVRQEVVIRDMIIKIENKEVIEDRFT